MKNRITLLAFAVWCCTVSTLDAQTDKGDWLIGGQLELSTVENNSRFVLNPNAGFFLLNHLAIGANLNANFEKVGDIRTTALGLGPFARYYFGRGAWRLFLNLNAGYATQRTKLGAISTSANGFSWLGGAGVAWFVTDNAALETTIGYTSTNFKNFEPANGLAFRLGFQIYFDWFDAEKIGIRTR